jgi:hypothetical protein
MDTATQKLSNLGLWWTFATTVGYSAITIISWEIQWDFFGFFYGLAWNATLLSGNVFFFIGIEGLIIGLAQAIVLRKLFRI